jgi:hypothetical protein
MDEMKHIINLQVENEGKENQKKTQAKDSRKRKNGIRKRRGGERRR